MEGASLVLDEAGMVSSLQLTLDRQVTLFDFAIIPAIGGFVLAAALLLVIGFIAGFHEEDGLRITLNEHRFRVKTVSVSQMPQVSLVPVATIVATVLGASTLAGSLFPGVSIGIFLVLTSVVAAVAAGVGSLAFDVLHSLWVRRHAPNEIGVPLALTAGGGQPSFSSLVGASIESAGQLYLASEQENQASEKEIPLPDRVPIPDGSKIEVIKGTSLSFLDGPKILLKGESSLLLSNDEMGLKIGNDTYGLPRRIKAKADTTIEYNEATEPDFVPSGTRAGRRRYGSKQNFKLTLERHNEPQTNMLIALVPVFAVVFGVGAELGVIGLLSINFSDATGFGRFLVAALIAFVAVFVVWYVFWKIQRATSPQPGQLQPGNATSLP
jgi:hypothetical protein